MKPSAIPFLILLTVVISCKRERAATRRDLTVTCGSAREIGKLSSELREASGIAASRTQAGVFWMHNDSGSEPVLYRTNASGAILSAVRVAGATNVDWEDVAV